jgi:hypothetical protein
MGQCKIEHRGFKKAKKRMLKKAASLGAKNFKSD